MITEILYFKDSIWHASDPDLTKFSLIKSIKLMKTLEI